MTRRLKQLGELAALREKLAGEARELDEARARLEAEARQRDAASSEFRDSVADVTPLAIRSRVEHDRPDHPPLPKKRWEDNQQVLIASVSDEFEIDTLLHTDDELSFRRSGVGPDVLRKLRRGDWVIQDEVDLHGCRTDEARELLTEFVKEAVKRGLRCVRVVHGKGLGSKGRVPVLKGRARVWLAQKEEVIAFCQARPADGGSGALMVLLKPGTGRA